MPNIPILNLKKKKSGRLKKPPKWLHPKAIARDYTKELLALVGKIEIYVERIIIPKLPKLVETANLLRPDRLDDAWPDELEKNITSLKISLDTEFAIASNLALKYGEKVHKWNSREWQKILHSVLGVDVFQSEPWLVNELEGFSKQNVTLISSIKDESVRKIEGIAQRGIQAGTRHEEIAKQIREIYGNSKSRARVIARDQISKLNGQLTMNRQKAIGIKRYIWRTSMDERVRPSHQAKEGKTFYWDKPPSDTGHPGQDILCRCSAESILDDVIEES